VCILGVIHIIVLNTNPFCVANLSETVSMFCYGYLDSINNFNCAVAQCFINLLQIYLKQFNVRLLILNRPAVYSEMLLLGRIACME